MQISLIPMQISLIPMHIPMQISLIPVQIILIPMLIPMQISLIPMHIILIPTQFVYLATASRVILLPYFSVSTLLKIAVEWRLGMGLIT